MEPHGFWQELHAEGTFEPGLQAGGGAFVAVLPGGGQVVLPTRVLPDGSGRVASLIVNQASFVVLDVLAEAMATIAGAYRPDVVVGVPTLGLPLAEGVARRLGHGRIVPLGTSRKFWYDDALAEPLKSITTPGGGKQIYVDPRMLPLLTGRRVLLVDDVVSSGASLRAVLRLLGRAGVEPVAVVVAMLQTERWRDVVAEVAPGLAGRVRGVFETPLLPPPAEGEGGI